ncbi:MAG: aminotransferase class V-fold PLP-dependent enzyme [Caldisericia bacterium]|nr:aminotransferase class V-fold PLP-dependent enzyme [Caldisericia bacterium]
MPKNSKAQIFDAIKNFTKENKVSFHMPGHFGGILLPEKLKAENNIFAFDITEVEGLDYLHQPNGVIKNAQKLAAKAFGADKTFFLVNGSTVGVISMIMASVLPGEKILVQRNSHQSVISGLTIGRCKPVWMKPELVYGTLIATGISSQTLKKAILENPDAKAVLLTSPNYLGMTQDMQELICIAHENNLIVLVDEAHGAHFHFNSNLPSSSVDLGADIVTQSTHKNLPALTQTALLHTNGTRFEIQRLKTILSMLQSSSPSYLLMSSIDCCIEMVTEQGEELINKAIETAHYGRKILNEIDSVEVFNEELIGTKGIKDWDKTKLIIDVSKTEMSGFKIKSILHEKYRIEIEFASINYLLCLITAGNTKKDIDKLSHSLKEILLNRKENEMKIAQIKTKNLSIFARDLPDQKFTPSEVLYMNSKTVNLEEAIGKVSKNIITPYPPGIPYLCPGEIITKNLIREIEVLKINGALIQGIHNNTVEVISS